jgi:hypothetical protein
MSKQIFKEPKVGECMFGNEKEQQVKIVESGNGYFALLTYDEIQRVEGRILTIVDASFPDKEQREAVKSLVRTSIWHWADNMYYKNWSTLNCSTGIPTSASSIEK